VLIGHSMGGLIATRYAQRYGDELAALVLSGPAIGGNPEFEMLARDGPDPRRADRPAVLSRDPAVGEAYAADPLVYHGPFQARDARGFGAAVQPRRRRAARSATCRRSGSTARTTSSCRSSTRGRRSRRCGRARFEEKIYPGARHEIFNETNRDEVIDDVVAFLRGAVG
jgi:alpha-beta hydrolase superfamily lysophospholipase